MIHLLHVDTILSTEAQKVGYKLARCSHCCAATEDRQRFQQEILTAVGYKEFRKLGLYFFFYIFFNLIFLSVALMFPVKLWTLSVHTALF